MRNSVQEIEREGTKKQGGHEGRQDGRKKPKGLARDGEGDKEMIGKNKTVV